METTLGAALRAARLRAGISIDVLARRINFHRTYVSKVENGLRRGSRDFVERCDAALGAGGDLVAVHDQSTVVHASAAQDGVALPDMYRRTFLNLGAKTAAGVAALAGIDLTGGRPRITPTDVDRLDQIVHRLRDLDERHGAADLWDVAADRAHGIAALLDQADYSDEAGAALVRVAGRAYLCAGRLATDAGRHDAAHTCYTEALAFAGQADSPRMTVQALANLAISASRLHRPRQALRCLAAAERALPTTSRGEAPAQLQAQVHARRGQALALLGDRAEAGRAFGAARRTLDNDRQPTGTWIGYFSHAEIDGLEGTAAVDLRTPKQGAALIEKALAGYDSRYARARTSYLLWLAKARAADGQVDGAAEVTGQALDLFDSDVASVRVGAELRRVAGQLHPYRRVPAVADVLARYRTTPYAAAA